MNREISSAVVMRIREFGESDLLVWFFTADRGYLKGVAKGARRSRKRFLNCLDLFCLAKMEYEVRPRGDLLLLHSCRLEKGFSNLREDFYRISLASYMVELTEVLFPLGVASGDMFLLLRDSLNDLDRGGEMSMIRPFFESRAMALGGYGIDLGKCCRCGRPYKGEGSAVFIPSSGGISCLNCCRDAPRERLLGPEEIKILSAAQSGLCAPPSVPLSASKTEGVFQIQAVMKQHITYQVGKAFKSAAYLE